MHAAFIEDGSLVLSNLVGISQSSITLSPEKSGALFYSFPVFTHLFILSLTDIQNYA